MILYKYKPVTGIEIMAKSKGGKGQKASYKTVVMRVPLELKIAVTALVDEYHSDDKIAITGAGNQNLKELIISKLEEYKFRSKTSRDWTMATKLMTELEEILKTET